MEIEELMQSNNLEDVILGVRMAYNTYGKEYFGTIHNSKSYKLYPHNLKDLMYGKDKDFLIVFKDCAVVISSFNFYYYPSHEIERLFEKEIIYDDREC